MSGEQRKFVKSSASIERTAGQRNEDKNDRQAPLVRFDTSVRAPAKSQVSNDLLRKLKKDVFAVYQTELSTRCTESVSAEICNTLCCHRSKTTM
jgi:hypothetical protein